MAMPGQGSATAEALLMAEVGPEAVQVLKPYYSALVGVADLARTTGGQQLRSLLRHLGVLTCKVATLEDGIAQWRAVAEKSQGQLAQASAALAAARQSAEAERSRAAALQAQLLALQQEREASSVVARSNAQWLQVEAQKAHAELQRNRGEVHALNEEIRRLRVELQVTSTKQRQQESQLEAERLRAAGADLSAENAGKAKARLEAALRRVDDDQRESVDSLTTHVQDERRKLERRLEAQHQELIAARKVVADREAVLAEVRCILPSTLHCVDFLRDTDSPALKLARGPVLLSMNTSVRVPVLALRWGPGISLNSTPSWQALRGGLFALLHQLQTGATLPEQVELTVCEANGRWFCCEQSEAPRFAALLLFQALKRDMPVAATCRVGSPHKVMSLQEEMTQHNGLSVLSSGAIWRTPPQDEEDFLRALLVDSPLRDVVNDFLYHQRRSRVEDAFEEELKRDLAGPFSRREREQAVWPSGGGRASEASEVAAVQVPSPDRRMSASTLTSAAQAASAAAAAAAARERAGVERGPPI
ncbi:unnamed protein product [Effrenium voratum]|uniref:Uncharacterized protein n=1 Tax=Effrenium voratum TaxID=2562239 RepID=A0AA36IBI0_9DINO|nr:unnamed protein product [Effrenium voratum]CAJ1417289.1 unnamed protein product [Effrenium voratum]